MNRRTFWKASLSVCAVAVALPLVGWKKRETPSLHAGDTCTYEDLDITIDRDALFGPKPTILDELDEAIKYLPHCNKYYCTCSPALSACHKPRTETHYIAVTREASMEYWHHLLKTGQIGPVSTNLDIKYCGFFVENCLPPNTTPRVQMKQMQMKRLPEGGQWFQIGDEKKNVYLYPAGAKA